MYHQITLQNVCLVLPFPSSTQDSKDPYLCKHLAFFLIFSTITLFICISLITTEFKNIFRSGRKFSPEVEALKKARISRQDKEKQGNDVGAGEVLSSLVYSTVQDREYKVKERGGRKSERCP